MSARLLIAAIMVSDASTAFSARTLMAFNAGERQATRLREPLVVSHASDGGDRGRNTPHLGDLGR